MGDVITLLDRDVYSMNQVDRLLDLSSGTATRWIDGYSRRDRRYEPLVRVASTGSELVTWGEFVEARLISEYRRQGVSVFRMRLGDHGPPRAVRHAVVRWPPHSPS